MLSDSGDIAVALGVIPVAVPIPLTPPGQEPAHSPWLSAALAGKQAPAIVTGDPRSAAEELLPLELDLIVATGWMPEDAYRAFADIAPTVLPPEQDQWLTWEERIRLQGTALGRLAQAESLISDMTRQFARVAADHPEFSELSVGVASAGSDVWIFRSEADVTMDVLSRLGFQPAPFIIALTSGYSESVPVPVPVDQLAANLDADVVVLMSYTEEIGPSALADPRVAALPQVARGSTVVLNGHSVIDALVSVSPLSLPWLLERVVPELIVAAAAVP